MPGPMSARDLFTIGYTAFIIMGGCYLFSAALLLAEYRKRDTRKRKGIAPKCCVRQINAT